MPVSVCPRPDALQSYLLGDLPDQEAEALDAHLTACPACLAALQKVEVADGLLQALRSQRGRPRFHNPLIEQLRLQLRQLRPIHPADASLATPNSTIVSNTCPSVNLPPGITGPNEGCYPFLAPAQTANELGRLGIYRVLAELGAGGMGVVFLAEDTVLKRRVALKVMRPALASGPQARQRFLREAQATAALCHDHIVVIYQVAEENGVPYLAMPFLVGETLDNRLHRLKTLPLPEALRIGREIALGLAVAHEQGIIHRDIKPSNLWLEAPQGRVKILDFGLAWMECPEGERTTTGAILGTPGYMAPEQLDGSVDARADLFSLGCVLYRLLAGRMPFKGETPLQRLRSLVEDTPLPLIQFNPNVPPAVAAFIHKMLAKKREERPVSAAVVARVLETMQGLAPPVAPLALPVAVAMPGEGKTSPGQESTILDTSHRVASRRWRAAALAVAAIVLVGFPALALFLFKGPLEPPIDPPSGPAFDPDAYVSQPPRLKGVKSWNIEVSNDWLWADPLFFLKDGRLVVIGGSSGRQGVVKFCWNNTSNTVEEAPFGSDFDVLAPDGKKCAKHDQTKKTVILKSLGPNGPTPINPGLGNSWSSFSPNSKLLAVWADRVRIFDAKTGLPLVTSPNSYRGFCVWSPNNEYLAISGSPGNGSIVHANSLKEWKKIDHQDISAIVWSPDSEHLVAIDIRGRLVLINTQTGVIKFRSPEEFLNGDDAIAWSPVDNKKVAYSRGPSKDVVIWDVEKKEVVKTFPGNSIRVGGLAFAPDGKTLIAARYDGSVRFWDVATGNHRGTLKFLADRNWVAISPDGHYKGSSGVEKLLHFKCQTEDGTTIDTFTAEDFVKNYDWKNNENKIKLLPR